MELAVNRSGGKPESPVGIGGELSKVQSISAVASQKAGLGGVGCNPALPVERELKFHEEIWLSGAVNLLRGSVTQRIPQNGRENWWSRRENTRRHLTVMVARSLFFQFLCLGV